MHTHPPAAVSVLLALLVLLLQLHTRSDHATLPTLPPESYALGDTSGDGSWSAN